MRLKHLFILLLLPLFVILTANKAAEKMPDKPMAATIDKSHKPTFVERFLIKKIAKKLSKSLTQQDSTQVNDLTEEIKKGKLATRSGSLGAVSLGLGILGIGLGSVQIMVLGLGLAAVLALVALSKSRKSKTKEARGGRCLGIGILIVAGLIAYWLYVTKNSG
jgi:hypothetical protein